MGRRPKPKKKNKKNGKKQQRRTRKRQDKDVISPGPTQPGREASSSPDAGTVTEFPPSALLLDDARTAEQVRAERIARLRMKRQGIAARTGRVPGCTNQQGKMDSMMDHFVSGKSMTETMRAIGIDPDTNLDLEATIRRARNNPATHKKVSKRAVRRHLGGIAGGDGSVGGGAMAAAAAPESDAAPAEDDGDSDSSADMAVTAQSLQHLLE